MAAQAAPVLPKQEPEPCYEVDPERYFSQFLSGVDLYSLGTDAEHLRPFVANLGEKVLVPSVILAVGSSTFPEEFWDARRKLKREYPRARVLVSYEDIDLLVVPEEVVPLQQLEFAVQRALTSMGFEFQTHQTTTAGVHYCRAFISDRSIECGETVAPFVNFDYGMHSISTRLSNRRRVDLILGRDDLLEETASQKIAQERSENHAFSLLYR